MKFSWMIYLWKKWKKDVEIILACKVNQIEIQKIKKKSLNILKKFACFKKFLETSQDNFFMLLFFLCEW